MDAKYHGPRCSTPDSKMIKTTSLVATFLMSCGFSLVAAEPTISWKACLRQRADWYREADAIRIADNVLLYQRNSGGWPKNTDMARILSETEQDALIHQKGRTDSTIDNGATVRPLRFLARVYNAAQMSRHEKSFLRGFDYLLEAQYDHGGWPQVFPLARGYSRHVTFNDGAMVGVLELLRDVAGGDSDYGFVDQSRRQRAAAAIERGIDCILKCQVIVDGQRTAWCAQHDEVTLRPAPARSYEKISLSGSESVGIVRFLMKIEEPSPEVVAAIEDSVAWFRRVRLTRIRQVQRPDATLPKGYDKVIVADANAPPLWARFYELGTNRPIFCGRDGVIKYQLAEIEHERRVGYAWYTQAPTDLVERDYPAWKARQEGAP